MKFIIIVIGLLLSSQAFAVGNAGYRLDGTYDTTQQNVSRPSITIKGCGIGRMRRIKNYQVKCEQRTKSRLRNTQARKSVILQRQAPRYRMTSRPDVARTQKERKISVYAQQAVYWRNFWKARGR